MPSFVAEFIAQNPNATPEDHQLCQEVATQFYGGASPTRMVARTRALIVAPLAGSDTVRTSGRSYWEDSRLTPYQTASALLSFFLILAQYPDVQRKAQAEVDAVVGDRPPKCSDRKNMPYLEALLKEVHRWRPVLPIGTCSSSHIVGDISWL